MICTVKICVRQHWSTINVFPLGSISIFIGSTICTSAGFDKNQWMSFSKYVHTANKLKHCQKFRLFICKTNFEQIVILFNTKIEVKSRIEHMTFNSFFWKSGNKLDFNTSLHSQLDKLFRINWNTEIYSSNLKLTKWVVQYFVTKYFCREFFNVNVYFTFCLTCKTFLWLSRCNHMHLFSRKYLARRSSHIVHVLCFDTQFVIFNVVLSLLLLG